MAHPFTPAKPSQRILSDPRSTGGSPRPPVVDILGLRGTKKTP